jgi:hypothetical protein
MSTRLRSWALVVGVGAAALGASLSGLSGVQTAGVQAEENQLPVFEIVAYNGTHVRLEIHAAPHQVGSPCTIQLGQQPYTGMVVGELVLEPGANFIVVPSTLPGTSCWYTATGPLFDPTVVERRLDQDVDDMN